MPRFSLFPSDARYFDLFEQAAANLVAAACHVESVLAANDFGEMAAKATRMDEIEHANDAVTHEIMNNLHKTFVTPWDREDIVDLTQRLDDVVDALHQAIIAITMYKVPRPTSRSRELGGIITQLADEVQRAVQLLRHQGKLRDVLPHAVEINRLENAADQVFRQAMAELFENEISLPDVIKWREIYDALEAATDRCEDIADVLEGVVLKHA